MNLEQLESYVNEQMASYLKGLEKVKPEECGLDIGFIYGPLYLDLDDKIIITNVTNQERLDYYGGFEYIDESAISRMGDYIIYRACNDSSDIVMDAIDYYSGHFTPEDEE